MPSPFNDRASILLDQTLTSNIHVLLDPEVWIQPTVSSFLVIANVADLSDSGSAVCLWAAPGQNVVTSLGLLDLAAFTMKGLYGMRGNQV